jgi:DNA-binding MarR family transcriptional regulator
MVVGIRELPRVEVLEAEVRRASTTLDPATILAFLSVLIASSDLDRLLEPHFARYGLSPGRFVILMGLRHRFEQTATPADLANHAGVKRSTITGLLDGLEKEGLVERSSRSDDRRSVLIHLTKKGNRLIERILPDHYARIGSVMSKMSKAEMKQLTVLLGKLREGIAESTSEVAETAT